TMRRFPGLRKELGRQDDLRRAVFDQIRQDSPDCKSLSYDDDVEPWIGNRVAVAAVPDAKRIALPVVALQIGDEAAAKKGMQAILDCSDGDEVGISFSGDYALVTEKQADADRVAQDAEAASLADDPDYRTWLDRAGDPGIVTMYASKDVPDAIVRGMKRSMASAMEFGDDPGFSVDPNSSAQMRSFEKQMRDYQERAAQRVRDELAGFEGAAGVVRFADGAVEAEAATKGFRKSIGGSDGAGRAAATLPASTAAALSLAVRPGWVHDYLEGMSSLTMGPGTDPDQVWREAERATGLHLPEDLETMLGDGVTVSVDSSANLRDLAGDQPPTDLPAGIRIQGDPSKIVPIIDKLKRAAGPQADLVHVEQGAGVVAVSLSADYAARLVADGDLGGQDAYQRVVPESDRAGALFFVDFDADNGWGERLADLVSGGDAEARANVEPLDALGASAWVDDSGVTHGLVRLTTD
ncbi:MAG: hypothetical protein HOQ22_07385, partial [Nocardioidaceae bacterium]|nr:hypothetical protein [Nocardioidaceae bacterium]